MSVQKDNLKELLATMLKEYFELKLSSSKPFDEEEFINRYLIKIKGIK